MIVTVDVLVARMETIYKEENATIILEDVLNTNKIYAYSVQIDICQSKTDVFLIVLLSLIRGAYSIMNQAKTKAQLRDFMAFPYRISILK